MTLLLQLSYTGNSTTSTAPLLQYNCAATSAELHCYYNSIALVTPASLHCYSYSACTNTLKETTVPPIALWLQLNWTGNHTCQILWTFDQLFPFIMLPYSIKWPQFWTICPRWRENGHRHLWLSGDHTHSPSAKENRHFKQRAKYCVVWMIGNVWEKMRSFECFCKLVPFSFLTTPISGAQSWVFFLTWDRIISCRTATGDPFHLISLIRAQHTWRSVACGRTQRSLSCSVTPSLLLSTLKVSQSCSPAAYYCLPASRASISATTLWPLRHRCHWIQAEKGKGMYEEAEIRKLEDIITALLALKHNHSCRQMLGFFVKKGKIG